MPGPGSREPLPLWGGFLVHSPGSTPQNVGNGPFAGRLGIRDDAGKVDVQRGQDPLLEGRDASRDATEVPADGPRYLRVPRRDAASAEERMCFSDKGFRGLCSFPAFVLRRDAGAGG